MTTYVLKMATHERCRLATLLIFIALLHKATVGLSLTILEQQSTAEVYTVTFQRSQPM